MRIIPYFLLAALLLFAHDSKSQEEYEHLFKDRRLSVSILFGPLFEFSSVHNSFGFAAGGGAAILFNQTVFVGTYGFRLSPVTGTGIALDGTNFDNVEIDFRHGGIWLGYIHNHRKLVHFGGSLKFGWGRILLDDARLPSNYEDNIMAITPQFDTEVNVSHWFKINLGIGYRIVTGVNEAVFEQRQFSSPQATLGFVFGWFK